MDNLCNSNGLTRIEEIRNQFAFISGGLDDRRYFEACHAFSRTLTRLNLNLYYFNTHFAHHFFNKLACFTSLTYLSITSGNDDFPFFGFLYNLPNLKTLKYRIYQEVGRPGLIRKEVPTSWKDPAMLTYHSKNLKYLSLCIPSLTAPYVEYITSCTPHTLNNIKIGIGKGLYNWIQNINTDTFNTFVKHLILMKNVSIFSGDYNSLPPNIQPNEMNSYHSFMNKLKGNRDLHCDVIMEEGGPYILIGIIDIKHITMTHLKSRLHYQPQDEEEGLISTIGRESVQSLKFHTNSRDFEQDLKYGIQNFSRLEILDIEFHGNMGCCRCQVMTDKNDKNTIDINARGTNIINKSLTILIFIESKYFLLQYQASILFTYLPNIKTISCEKSDLWSSAPETQQNEIGYHQEVELNVLQFVRLTRFDLDVYNLIHMGFADYKFFKINYFKEDSEEAAYYKLQAEGKRMNRDYRLVPVTAEFVYKHCNQKYKVGRDNSSFAVSILTVIKCNEGTEIFIKTGDVIIAKIEY